MQIMNNSQVVINMLPKTFDLSLPYVYLLWDKGEVVYVGQTFNIKTRIQAHLKSKEFKQVSLIECTKEDIDEVENHNITTLKPKYNKKYNPDYRRQEDSNAKVDESLKEIIQGAAKRAGFNGVMALSRSCDLSYERVSRVYGGSVSAKLSDVAHVASVLGLKIKFVKLGEE